MLVALYVLIPAPADAAESWFVSDMIEVGSESHIFVMMSSDDPINAVEMSIHAPDGLRIVDASDGDSVVNFWVERPMVSEDMRSVRFAGIIPGGFSGAEGKVIDLSVIADRPGQYTMSFDASSKLYMNDPTAAGIEIQVRPSRIIASVDVATSSAAIQSDTDVDPPEPFTPVYARISDGDEDFWVVSFETQDKGSGVYLYQVAETRRPVDMDDRFALARLTWTTTWSPYRLSDQETVSHIYVKAVDRKGNVRFGHLDPLRHIPWYRGPIQYILILTVSIALLVFLWSRRRAVR